MNIGKVAVTFTMDGKPDIVVYRTLDEILSCVDVYDLLAATEPACNSSSCNNESQNFCDCGGEYGDYEYSKIEYITA
jgi:hypothetical protein